jgi:hypothetical protein
MVTSHEVDRDENMATYDSLCYLRGKYPDCTFSFVVGSDWLQPGTDLRQWTSKEGRTGERLVSEFDFLVLRRPPPPAAAHGGTRTQPSAAAARALRTACVLSALAVGVRVLMRASRVRVACAGPGYEVADLSTYGPRFYWMDLPNGPPPQHER